MSARIIRNIIDTPNLAPIQFPEHIRTSPSPRIKRPAPKIAERISAQTKNETGTIHDLAAQARAQAEAILSEAYAEAQRIENNAYEQGYKAGQEAALISNEER